MQRTENGEGLGAAGEGNSSLRLATPKISFRDLVASWRSGDDAIRWATGKGITREQFGNSGWLRSTSAELSPKGIGESLRGLYDAIIKDSRFQTEGVADFAKFRVFLGFTEAVDYGALVSSWVKGKDALAWAAAKGITGEQLGNSNWLGKTSAELSPKGIGESLYGLYDAIKKDSRFQTEGVADFAKFRVFLGFTEAVDYGALVSSWVKGKDALAWATGKGITGEQLGNSRWLGKTSAEPSPKGIGESLRGLYYAIKKDSRFQTEGVADFAKFRVFLGFTEAVDYGALVSSWVKGKDALAWAASKGIPGEQLGNSKWLQKTSAEPSPKGIGESLRGLYYAIKKDSRFQTEGVADFAKFRVFLGFTEAVDYGALVSSWVKGKDALAWATGKGITGEQLGNSKWLQRTSSEPTPEGIGESLQGLYNAIIKDSRFQTEGVADFAKFRVFLGFTEAVDYGALVSSWKKGEDALAWATGKGITGEQLGNSNWLGKTSAELSPKGIGESLRGLYDAIIKDSRFQTEGVADFAKFRVFLGFTEAVDYGALVSSWKKGKDALAWATGKGITGEQLGNSKWLGKTSAEPSPKASENHCMVFIMPSKKTAAFKLKE